jgi:hypothetical protein
MQFNGLKLTPEQEHVVDCIKSGEDTKVQAPAGSGKTFVLEAAASVIPEKVGIYLAFNKAIADSAGKKFGTNVECRTGHSVAFREVGKDYSHKFGKLTGWVVCNHLGIVNPAPFPTISSRGYLILDALRNFCYSNDPKITYRVVPKLKGNFKTPEAHKEAQKIIASDADRLWDLMEDPECDVPITHDFYLKLWALSKPIIDRDFILFDEAQDANPVMLGVIARQKHAQKIWVGDQFQQIYSWRGAINAMQRIPTEHNPFLTQSFRFGDAIANVASDILTCYMAPENAPPRIKGFEECISDISYSTITDPNVVICRTNNGVITNVFKYLNLDKKVYVQGGTKQIETLLKGAKDLKNGKTTWVPDLALFKSWGEVLQYAGSESGSDLRGLVNIVDRHDIDELLGILGSTQQSAAKAEITLTTGHKAKGLEWSKVQLYSDFAEIELDDEGKMRPMRQEDINILYVSATRALNTLDVSQCRACHPVSFKKSQQFFGIESNFDSKPKLKKIRRKIV